MLYPLTSRPSDVIYIVGGKIRVKVGRMRQYKSFKGFVRRVIAEIFRKVVQVCIIVPSITKMFCKVLVRDGLGTIKRRFEVVVSLVGIRYDVR
jgi:ASC-1-like (ASCH) protein